MSDGRGVTRGWIAVAAVLAILWLFVRATPLDARVAAGHLLVGVVVGGATAYLFRRLYAPRVDVLRVLRTLPYAALYVALFARELVTANVDVAYRVLAPGIPISPRVIEMPLRVETDPAVTVIANSITLTPGTLTMDHDAEANVLYVHAIDGRNPEDVLATIRRWEDYALVMFDEARKPGDPVPEPRGGEDGGE